MDNVLARYRTVAEGFAKRLKGITPEQWSASTPCSEWSTEDLVAHVVGIHQRILEGIDKNISELFNSDALLKQWETAYREVTLALENPIEANKVVQGFSFAQPLKNIVDGMLCTDVLIHTWDLARATGQDESLNPEAVVRAMDFIKPKGDAIRASGSFGNEINSNLNADEQTRLLNFCGRVV